MAYLRSIHSHEETDEVGADEPYVLVTAVNLASMVSVAGFPVPLPAYDVVRYGFDDVDEGETHFAPGVAQSFWGTNGTPEQLTDPESAIFIVSLMENDGNDGRVYTSYGTGRSRWTPSRALSTNGMSSGTGMS